MGIRLGMFVIPRVSSCILDESIWESVTSGFDAIVTVVSDRAVADCARRNQETDPLSRVFAGRVAGGDGCHRNAVDNSGARGDGCARSRATGYVQEQPEADRSRPATV